MIVITGPGRSGTSFLAQAYLMAGIKPGGLWHPEVRAGFEDREIVQLNRQVLEQLQVSTLGVQRRAPRAADLPVPPAMQRWLRDMVPTDARQRFRAVYEASALARARRLKLLDWQKVSLVGQRMATRLRRASDRTLCKDPQFCWTLPVWVAAGASISHVVVSTRDTSKTLESRRAADQVRFLKYSDAFNAIVYAVGVVTTTIADNDIPATFLRYPDHLHDLDNLALQLPRPNGLTAAGLLEALRASANSDPTVQSGY